MEFIRCATRQTSLNVLLLLVCCNFLASAQKSETENELTWIVKHERLPKTLNSCPVDERIDVSMCDVTDDIPSDAFMPDGTICLVEGEDDGLVLMFECLNGDWETAAERRGTSSYKLARKERFIGLIILLAFVIGCAFFCRRRNRIPEIFCPADKTFYSDWNSVSTTVTFQKPTAKDYEDGSLDTIRTSGAALVIGRNKLSEGTYTLYYKATDSDGAMVTCSFNLHVKVRRCAPSNPFQSVYNGYTSCTNGNVYGSTCYLHCYYGYRAEGTTKSTCLEKGWEKSYGSCKAISCGSPNYPSYGQFNCGGYTYGSTCYLSCTQPGYSVVGSSTITCQISGQWTSSGACVDTTPPVISCDSNRVVFSGPLNQPVYVNWPTPSVYDNSGQHVRLTSEPPSGTLLPSGVHQVTFTGVDSSNNIGYCYMTQEVRVKKCNSTQLATHFSNVTCSHEHILGSVCTVSCDVGYNLEGEATRTCQDDGKWSGDLAECVAVACPDPPEVSNGSYVCEKGQGFQDICSLECLGGYQALAPLAITCTINNTWTSAGSCQDSESPYFIDGCPPDMVVWAAQLRELTVVDYMLPLAEDRSGRDVEVVGTPSQGTVFDIGTTYVNITASDPDGNTANCSFRVIVTVPSCDPPNFDPNGKVLTYDCPDGYYFGATCSLGCFGTSLNQRITCSRNKSGDFTWTYSGSSPPKCQADACVKLKDPENGIFLCQKIRSKSMQSNSCRLKCNEGYTPSANSLYKCLPKIGLWTPEGISPNCTKGRRPKQVRANLKIAYTRDDCDNVNKTKLNNFIKQTVNSSGYRDYCDVNMSCQIENVTTSCQRPHRSRRQVDDLSKFILEVTFTIDLGKFMDLGDPQDIRDLYNNVVGQIDTSLLVSSESDKFNFPEVGQYDSFTPAEVEYICEAGTLLNAESMSCVGCGPGHLYNTATNSCVVCPRGSYQDQEISYSCNLCPNGTFTKQKGANWITQCIEFCPPGSVSDSGLVDCTACPIGTYQSAPGMKSCDLCPFGMTTSASGAATEAECQFYNIRLGRDTPLARVKIPDLENTSATFMMWVHPVTGSAGKTLTFSLDPIPQTSYFTVGPWKLFLQYETSSSIRDWFHIGITADQGNISYFVDGQEITASEQTPMETMSEIISNKNVTFQGTETLKSIVITGVQMTRSVLTWSEIKQFSSSCNMKVDENILKVDAVDKTLITPSTCDDINNCQGQPCGQHGVCIDGQGDVTCVCQEPWFGDRCQEVPDLCDDHKCHNRSTCQANPEMKTYECLCPKGYKGTLCEERAIDGNWSEWEIWTACSATCGPSQRSRVRHCDNPRPDPEGENCPGNGTEIQICNNNKNCPVDGQFGEWSDWTTDKQCNSGLAKRTRKCDSPAPTKGGKRCDGATLQVKNINKTECPVNGNFSDWSSWTQCSVTCGGGMKTRTRACNNPPPSNGGLPCDVTKSSQNKKCNENLCPTCTKLKSRGKYQSINCHTNETSATQYCKISCKPGYVLVPPDVTMVFCGRVNNYTWSNQVKNNPTGILPDCTAAKIPASQKTVTNVRYENIDCNKPPKDKEVMDGLSKQMDKSLPCHRNKTCKSHFKSKTTCRSKKRSTGSIIAIVSLELVVKTGNSNYMGNMTDEERQKQIDMAYMMEEMTLKFLNESETILSLTVNGVHYKPEIQSTQAEITCDEGSGFIDGFCVVCPAGSYSAGNGSCILCQKDFYQDQPKMAECLPCPEGLRTSGVGSLTLDSCQTDPPLYSDMFPWETTDDAYWASYEENKISQRGLHVMFSDLMVITVTVAATTIMLVIITIFVYLKCRMMLLKTKSTPKPEIKIYKIFNNPFFYGGADSTKENVYDEIINNDVIEGKNLVFKCQSDDLE